MSRFYQDKRILVTGAAGFIGSNLTQALHAEGARVTALVHYDARPQRSNLEYLPPETLQDIHVVPGDVTDPHFIHSLVRDQDIVFHLAALISIPYSYQAPAAFFQTNLTGTVNILEACRSHGTARLVCTSTSECYGTAQTTPMDEQHPLQAQSPYSASKIAADKAVESYCCSFGLPAVVVRPFNTYGPRQSARAILPAIITQVLSDSETIRLGSLKPARDLTFVDDTVAGFLTAGQAQDVSGEVINLGTGHAVTIGELVEKVFAHTNREKPIETDPERVRPDRSEVMMLLSDNRKAKRLLHWTPRVSLDDGIVRTIGFIRDEAGQFRAGHYLV